MTQETANRLKFRDPVKVEQQAQDLGGFVVEQAEEGSSEMRVQGCAAKYGNQFKVWAMPGMKYMRRQEPGSFARSLSQNPKVMLRRNHQNAFANTKAGTLQLEEREDGLYFSAMVSRENPEGLALLTEMRRGTLTESSVAYQIVRATYEDEEMPDGGMVRTQIVLEGDLQRGDVSVVQYGMNPQTTSGLAQGLVLAQRLAEDEWTATAVQQALNGGMTAGPPVEPKVELQVDAAGLQRDLEMLSLSMEVAAARAGLDL